MQLKKEQADLKEIQPVRTITNTELIANYFLIKKDIENLIETELEILLNTIG
jgi:hypothetical protein